jgi:Transglutaminase-like superfamily/Domain of unknown function (DUF4129)
MRRSIRLAPAEGWLTLALVALMCLTMARAFDDARWVLGREEYLDLLVVAAMGGVLCGFIGPKVGWGRWLTYLIGSIFAALIVPILTAVAGSTTWRWLDDLYVATASSAVAAYTDIAVRGFATTPQFLHHILVFGLIVWATSMFAAYAVFGHHRPLGGIVVVGIILVSNIWITANDQLPYLIVFTVAALLILVRSHVYDEEAEWLRRRIGDPSSISAVYLRGGTMFIGLTVVAAFLLTQTASSKPLAGAWGGVQDGILNISSAVARLLPYGGASRTLPVSFGPGAIGQFWQQDPGLALTINRDPIDPLSYYWRVETYDRIELTGRDQSESTSVELAAGAPIGDHLADGVDRAGLHQIDFTVTPVDYHQSKVVSAASPISVDEPVRLSTTGSDGDFAVIDRLGSNATYQVSAMVAVDGNEPGQLNEAALRATSLEYPAEISRLYLQLPTDGMFGPYSIKLRQQIMTEAKSTTPYDLADSAKRILQRDFKYETDISDLDCSRVSRVECFAHYKIGFCQYYAITMAAMLRDLGVPTRIVAGFLPGPRNGPVETIDADSDHEWVEVYFPGYGWVEFDPTPAGVSQLAALPSGRPVASADAAAAASLQPVPTRDRGPVEGDNGPSGAVDSLGRGSLGPLIGLGVLLLVVVGAAAFVAWRRGPRDGPNVDGAYGTVIRIASRLGFGRRPAETVYEYAGALGDVLPDVRPELQTVAHAKVESAYGRRVLSDDRLASLMLAQRRLRVSLLRLAFRRDQRRRR